MLIAPSSSASVAHLLIPQDEPPAHAVIADKDSETKVREMKPDAPVDPTITTRFALAEVTQCAGTAPTGPKRYANTITSNNSTRKSNVDVLAYLSLTLLPPNPRRRVWPCRPTLPTNGVRFPLDRHAWPSVIGTVMWIVSEPGYSGILSMKPCEISVY